MLTKEEIESYFVYSEDVPSGLRWKEDRYSGKFNVCPVTKAGQVAGYKRKKSGYWCVKIRQKAYFTHRIVYGMFNPDFEHHPKRFVDHKNGNKDDNTVSNLREVTQAENNRNSKLRVGNKTGVNGVYFFTSHGKGNYRAAVLLPSGKKAAKSFAIDKHGKEEAFKMACEWREIKLKELELQGVYYSERHGKPLTTEQAKKKTKSINKE